MPADRSGTSPEDYSLRVRALAQSLGVDLGAVAGSGEDGEVTIDDVLNTAMTTSGGAAAADAADTADTEEGMANTQDEAGEPPAEEPSTEERRERRRPRRRGMAARLMRRGGRETPAAEPDAVELAVDDAPAEAAAAPDPPQAGARNVTWTGALNVFAERLERAGEGDLGTAVRDYARRVGEVKEGRAPASAALVPPAVDPAMVGKTLAAGRTRRVFEVLVETVRNVLIFIPVLLTWNKIQTSGVNDLGDMRGTALAVVVLIAVLIGVHVVLGWLRQQRTARGEGIAREFAAALTNASMEASVQQTESVEQAISAFAQTGRDLTASLQGAGESLGGARDVMTRMADVVARQGEQVEGLVALLQPISRIGDQIDGVQRELSAAAVTMRTTARTLADIQANIAPTAGRLEETVGELGTLAQQLDRTGKQMERMTEVFAERFDPMDRSAANFEEAIRQLNLVSNRVVEALNVLNQARDGAGGSRRGG